MLAISWWYLFLQEAPYVIQDKTHPLGFRGFCVDLLEKISQVKGFNFTLYKVANNAYGQLENGTWNGVMGELTSKVGDMRTGCTF